MVQLMLGRAGGQLTPKLDAELHYDRVSTSDLVVHHGVGARHIVSSWSLQLDAQPFWQVSKGVHGVQARGIRQTEG